MIIIKGEINYELLAKYVLLAEAEGTTVSYVVNGSEITMRLNSSRKYIFGTFEESKLWNLLGDGEIRGYVGNVQAHTFSCEKYNGKKYRDSEHAFHRWSTSAEIEIGAIYNGIALDQHNLIDCTGMKMIEPGVYVTLFISAQQSVIYRNIVYVDDAIMRFRTWKMLKLFKEPIHCKVQRAAMRESYAVICGDKLEHKCAICEDKLYEFAFYRAGRLRCFECHIKGYEKGAVIVPIWATIYDAVRDSALSEEDKQSAIIMEKSVRDTYFENGIEYQIIDHLPNILDNKLLGKKILCGAKKPHNVDPVNIDLERIRVW